MAVIFALLVLLPGMKFAGKGVFFEDNFSVSQTRSLKGLFAVYVVLHHLCTYFADFYPSFYTFKYAGFLMVGGFFLISGYGLMYGVLNKDNYLKGFFKKRVLSILIPYYIINLFYLLARKISGGLTKKYIFMSLFGINLWYVFAILVLYVLFFASFKFFGKKKGIYVIGIFVILYISVMYILYTFFNVSLFGFWWYNSVICFFIGILYCNFKKKIDEFLKNKYFIVITASLFVFALCYYYVCINFNNNTFLTLFAEILCSLIFTVFLLAVTLKVKFGNMMSYICGDLSFELYLSHAIFIFALRCGLDVFGIHFYINSNFLYLLSIILCTALFSYFVHLISKKLHRFLCSE